MDPFLAVFHLAYLTASGREEEGALAAEALLQRHADTALFLFEASQQREHFHLARQAVALEPSFAEAHLVLGNAAAEAGRFGEAERHYQTVKKALPESGGAERALADLFFLMGDLPRALDAYDRVIAMEPDIHSLLRKGIVLTVLDRPEEAKQLLGGVLESHWMPGEANYWLGRTHLRLGALEEAAACVRETRRSLPNDPSTLLLGGQVSIAQGLWEAAEADLSAVARLAEANVALAGEEPLCESLFLRGRVDSHFEHWVSGLQDLRASGECYEAFRTKLDRQDQQIRSWGLSPDDEHLLLLHNDREKERAKDRVAAASYNAAVCALRSGQRELAAALASEAAKRPPLKRRAEELLRTLLPK